MLGPSSKSWSDGRVLSVQCLSGTGALRVGAEFLATRLKHSVFYYSDPTWGNHKNIFAAAGFKEGRTYRYWDEAKRSVDFAGMLADLGDAPENAVIILHACAHNPTGLDLTRDQWTQGADVMRKKKLFTFFDCAYQVEKKSLPWS